ncbi:phosphatidylglycerol lysyltransferase domain-containing protein [Histidinibacterium aquaticum]|uniref:DUF2156 domain-containing protein n=1 Tax=Histidinibacterium aquaticum TaxID=2613962 RepID=A0A5J5GP16_9RHOB|nr:phosphatidylglycerol lysyltransferase domain-containing protein [Histidinibacterium aquaticum]KAA9009797.1 DUF2156 domain-containing protein [Histidinibacterium aquaticum]
MPLRLSPWQALGLAVGPVLLWMLARRLDHVDLGEVMAALGRIGPGALLLALAATGASFLCLGAYDATVQAALGTGVPRGRAARAGRRAVAIGQVTGLGTLVGALVRWRALPELSLAASVHVSALVSLSFLAAAAPVTVMAALVWLPDMPLRTPVAVGGALTLVAVTALPLLAPRRLRELVGGLDHGKGLRLALWATADTAFAALALWACLPAGVEISFGPLFAAYLAALSAGLLTNAPGGLGAFELVLLALLPGVAAPDLLAGVLAFRAVYYALPALVSLPGLVAPRRPAEGLTKADPVRRARELATPPCPEWGLARQQAEIWTAGPDRALCLSRAPRVLAALGPVRGGVPLAELARRARVEGRWPALYKCDARTALVARQAGWTVLRVAANARIDLSHWDLEGPARRQLRRKLRQAEKAGVRISEAGELPLEEMRALGRAWAEAHGGERGFSCGTLTASLVRHQRVFLAHRDGRLMAFATAHATPGAWALDLMRHGEDVPAGTMHGLVAAMIGTARAEGAAHLSLAAVPDLAPPAQELGPRLCPGLRQFKESFGPAWQPLYLAVPNRLVLLPVVAALVWQIRLGHRLTAGNIDAMQDDLEENAIALAPGACNAPWTP